MGDAHSSDAIASAVLTSVHADFKAHTSLGRNETHIAATESIRARHPDSHVTAVKAHQCDILEYAAGGHAVVTLVWEGNNWQGYREYKPPKNRLEIGNGHLSDEISFGLYTFETSDKQYSFYTVKWKNMFEGTKQFHYILSPKADLDEHGRDPAIDELILAIGKWTSELHEEIYVFDDGDWTKSSKLWAAVQNASWDDVIIDPIMKKTLVQDVHAFFDSRELFEEYGVPWKRGIIFHGTPGCGKTISIKALMNSLGRRSPPVASLYVKSFDCCSGPQYSIRQIFEQARDMAPCLLIFEDLDSLVVNKVRSYFLNEVDGLEDNNGILMLGSTNHLERLDPGISKRPSRFDRKYHYKLPGDAERVLYSNYWKSKLERNSKVDFDPEISHIVAKLTDGFSFAYMKELFVQTLLALVGGRSIDDEEEEISDTSAVPATTSNLSTNDEETNKNAAKEPKIRTPDGVVRRVPQVEIPEHLKDNRLLKVLRSQLVALYKDMDNSKSSDKNEDEKAEDEDKSDKGEDGEDEDEESKREADYRRQRRLLKKMEDE